MRLYGQNKTTARRFHTFKYHTSAMQKGNAADYGEPKPRTAGAQVPRAVHAVETVEYAFSILRRDPHAMILD